MTPPELVGLVENARKHGLDFATLVIPRQGRGRRMRVVPGVTGQVLGATENGTIVSVRASDIHRWLLKHLSEIEGWAVEAMESGDEAEADRRLAYFVEVRDRLDALTPLSAEAR